MMLADGWRNEKSLLIPFNANRTPCYLTPDPLFLPGGFIIHSSEGFFLMLSSSSGLRDQGTYMDRIIHRERIRQRIQQGRQCLRGSTFLHLNLLETNQPC